MSNEHKMEFKAEMRQMMDIIVHSLYSHKEIFLRELISNAADAIGKIRFDALTNAALTEGDSDFKIKIIPDKDAGTLTICDNGIGMTRDEVVENLGTIARSGTRAFIDKIKQAKSEQNVDLIGQFGVGFYSGFMVADKVSVITRAPQQEGGVIWTSEGAGTFTVGDHEKTTRGTDVVLHLREDAKEYLDDWRLQAIVKKFSDFVEYPVILVTKEIPADNPDAPEAEGEKKAEQKEAASKEPVIKEKIVNSQQAIWLRPRADIKEEEYKEFYQHISHDFGEPLKTIHYTAEGAQEFKALLFIPKKKPYDFFMRDAKKGLQLYVNRVFITEECEKLLPGYLEFIRGVVDSSDLPLNVSREMLQEDRQLVSIRKALVGKIFSTLKEMQEKELPTYLEFWEELGVILKSGLSNDYENRAKLADLFLFQSTRTEKTSEKDGEKKEDTLGKYVTLAQYVEAMPEDQKEIYYMIAESREMVENSPYMEQFRSKGYEVLVMTDPVDELVVQALPEYKEKKLRAIDRGELEVEKETETEKEQKQKENKDLLASIKEILGEAVSEVKLSNRLKESPACLVGREGQYGAQMERLMKEMGADTMKRQESLEINPAHPAIVALRKLHEQGGNEARLKDFVQLIYDGAVIAAGEKVKDPGALLRRCSALIADSAQ